MAAVTSDKSTSVRSPSSRKDAGGGGVGATKSPQSPRRQQHVAHRAIMVGDFPAITDAELAAMSDSERKDAIGQRLYSLLRDRYEGERSRHITNMLLELATSDLIHMLMNHGYMVQKAQEMAAMLDVQPKQRERLGEDLWSPDPAAHDDLSGAASAAPPTPPQPGGEQTDQPVRAPAAEAAAVPAVTAAPAAGPDLHAQQHGVNAPPSQAPSKSNDRQPLPQAAQAKPDHKPQKDDAMACATTHRPHEESQKDSHKESEHQQHHHQKSPDRSHEHQEKL